MLSHIKMRPLLGSLLLLAVAQGTSAQLCNSRSLQPAPNNDLPTCSLPVADYVSGRPLAGSVERTTAFPSWMNWTLAKQGQQFATNNIFSIAFGAFPGLVIGLPIPDEQSVLAFTGNTANANSAIQRYLATGAQFQVWMESLFSGAPTAFNPVLTSINNVRQHHIKAAQGANAVGLPYVPSNLYDNVTTDDVMWAAVAADLAASSFPVRTWPPSYTQYDTSTVAINQYVQGLTLIGFMGYFTVDPTSVFVWNATQSDRAAFLHAWAVVGWLLGIEDDYNLCLQPDPDTAATYVQQLNEQYVYPAWFQIDKIGKVLVEAVLVNYNQFLPGPLTPRALMVRLLRDYFKIDATNTLGTLNPLDASLLAAFDATFVPSTKDPLERGLLNTAFDGAIDGGVTAFFGPYLTYMGKAKHVFYPNVTG